MNITNMMKPDQYERTRRTLAEWDAQAAAQVAAKKAAGYYKPQPDPRKQEIIPAGTVVTFERGGRKATGAVVRHEDRKNSDGENDYGYVRIYWIRDSRGQVVPVDSEKISR